MTLRNKLAASYTTAFTLLLSVTFATIFFISKKNRVNEFHQRFREKTLLCFRLYVNIHDLDGSVLDKLDKNIINAMRNNNSTFLFDTAGNLIYSSCNTGIPAYAIGVIQKLVKNNDELFMPTNEGELFGIRFTAKGKTYFGIAKAEDKFGKQTMRFLALLLFASFLISVCAMVLLSYYLSGKITAPISALTKEIETISAGKLSTRVTHKESKSEVAILAGKFNEMLAKVEKAFRFQQHFIRYISHELRTPLAIMMSNTEYAISCNDVDALRNGLQYQKGAIKELSQIIATILEISKKEGDKNYTDDVRIDELVFECFDEIVMFNENASLDFNIDQQSNTTELTIKGNSVMLKLALFNLIKNAVDYSTNKVVKITVMITERYIQLLIVNDGATLSSDDAEHLFKRVFRGANSNHIPGFGLGLSLANRIISMHNGLLQYCVTHELENCFSLQFEICDL